MMKFKPTQQNEKKHVRNLIDLVNQVLHRVESGVVVWGSEEVSKEGVVRQYLAQPWFKLTHQKFHKNTEPRVMTIQSPASGVVAMEIFLGRDYKVTVFCTKQDAVWVCGSCWIKADLTLGNLEFRVAPALLAAYSEV